ncbi:MAG: methyltransferase domain-containing protein, partial [Gemmatimonadetes bacterium]|nr:methyltransferase domain-containing protein [Gemmatimonadota bacterium]
RMHFLHAALTSGLLESLDGPRTRAELLSDLDVKRPELLDALLELGVSLGELGRDGGGYRLKGGRARALRKEKNDALSAMVQANVTYYNSVFQGFDRRLKGGGLDEGLGAIGPLVARVSKIADPYVEHFLSGIVRGKGPLRVLDVGCGSGSHLRRAVEVNPEVTAIGLDSDPEVVRKARENVALWGLEGRVHLEEGDVRSLPADAKGPFDLVLVFSVIYYFGEDEREDVLRKIRDSLAPEGRVALVTSCRGEGADLFSANLNLATSSMAGLTPLPEVTEMENQLRAAGFAEVRRSRLIPRTTYFGFLAS